LTAACGNPNSTEIGKYDTDNVSALRKLVANGAELRPFSREILDACYKATQEYYAELSQKNPKRKAIYDPWRKFLDDEVLWYRLDELSFDAYMATTLKKA
jgi:TRAP-type mannitol/chloroaromatic compound transport system substrate-binding protein